MSISLKCSCGARLEVDPKFAGQTIACPDCSKPLTVALPPPPARRTSGLALASVLTALIGAFTIVGTLAAMVLGAIAYRRIPRQSGVGGQNLAKAGMILGAVLTLVALTAYSATSVLGLDSLLRRYYWAGKLQFPADLSIFKETTLRAYSLRRPSPSWGVLHPLPFNVRSGGAMLVNLRDDAHVLWLSEKMHLDEDAYHLRKQAIELFKQSELLKLVGLLPEKLSEDVKERDIVENGREQQFFYDVTLSGIPRTFLFRLMPDGDQLNVIVGGARTARFTRLEPQLREATQSFQQELNR